MTLDWESVVNEIMSNENSSSEQRKDEINKYIKYYVELYYKNEEMAEEIKKNFNSILWMYERLTSNAENNNVSWQEAEKFDADLYASMIFTAYYLQKAWGTVADFPPPLSVARVIGYALIVGYRLGIMGGQKDEL